MASSMWSPAGTLVAFSRLDGRVGILVADVETGRVRRLTTGVDGTPAWDPSGRRLDFMREVELHPNDPRSQLYIVGADGRELRRLTNFAKGPEASELVSWSPDGQRVAFAGSVHGGLACRERGRSAI